MGFRDIAQRVGGQALNTANRLGGFKVTYTLCTDETTDPLSTTDLTIYATPAEDEYRHVNIGGRTVEATGARDFLFSREAFNSGGTYYSPTPHDSFVVYGTTTPVYRVHAVRGVAGVAIGYRLTCTAEAHESARG